MDATQGGGQNVEVTDSDAIQTESLGFAPFAGDAKVQLTPKWSPPPAPTASLLAIASRKGIVAAAGPDGIYIAPTDSVRKAFDNDKNGDTEVRPFDAQTKIPMSIRISHLAFTPDEQYLIVSAEQGGGLAVYETQTLFQGNGQAAFEISTSGEAVKTLVPNPMSELAEFCAVVTNNGNLLMANFKQKSLVNGSNGPVIRSGVTSAGWSTKGKQLVAGLASGDIVQMTPDGVEKAQIPKPAFLENYHVASIAWLENHLFLAVFNENTGSPPNSEFLAITRHAPAGQTPSFEFRKLVNPVPSFEDAAPHPTILRLRDHPPAIHELLIVASSATGDLGLVTKSKAPLATDLPADSITNVLITTEFTDDSRRATLPTDEDLTDTYPVGFALDLSSRDKVYKPVPADEEIEYSPGPLPAVCALNKDGVLAGWWMVYYDAVKENITYPGLTALQGEPAPQPAAPTTTKAPFASQPTSSAFGGSSAFGSTASALTPSSAPSNSFGAGSTTAAAPAFGAPSFGTPGLGGKPAAPAFGQAGGLGSRSSPWATASTNASPAFGSHGFSSSAGPAVGGSTGGKVFGGGAASSGSATGGGFASLAGQSGFASLGGNNIGQSLFSKTSSSASPFGAASTGQNAFGGGNQSSFGGGNQSSFGTGKPFGSAAFGSQNTSMDKGTAFPAQSTADKGGSTAFGASPFVLGTTFKADPATANDNEKPSGKGGLSLGGFGLSLDDSAPKSTPAEPKDDAMSGASSVEQEKPKSLFGTPQESTTPTSTPVPSRYFSSTDTANPKPNPFGGPASTSSLFGSRASQPNVSKANPFTQTSANQPTPSPGPFGSSFGINKSNPFAPTQATSTPEAADDTSDPPLPPDATSKAAYPFGESSSSSIASTKTTEDHKKPTESVDDAPLPPDFLAPKSKAKADAEAMPPPLPKEEPSVPEEAPLPPDFVTKPKSDQKLTSVEPSAAPSIPESSESDLTEDFDGDDQDGGEDEFGEEEAEDGGSEGSGVDVAKDISPSSTVVRQTPGMTPQSSFGGMTGSSFSLVSRPDVAQQPSRPSMFGSSAPVFPAPGPTSPRSPSPIRHALPPRMLPGEGSRSVSAPGVGPRTQSSGFSKTISSRVPPREDPNVALQKEAQKKQAEQEQHSLEDDEYERVQALLESPVDATLDIGEFNAFISVTADAHASTIAAQVEALYRDMNGMLVTLGLNARALAGFIQGHQGSEPNQKKTQDDLENLDDWVLCEAEDLNHILDDELARNLENGRVQDYQDTWDTCQDLERETQKLRARKQDLKRVLDNILDPDQAATARIMPLNTEQAAQQNELRQSYARVTKMMADAESALTMLKTKLATLTGKPNAVPTVDAIMRTIAKMTSAFEKRSGEIDILESQMRKLRMSGSLGPLSREGTPEVFRTPPPNRRLTAASGNTHSPSPLRSLNGSTGGRGGPSPRKKMSGFTADEKTAIRDKMQRRQAVLDRLRVKLVENGPKMSKMNDI